MTAFRMCFFFFQAEDGIRDRNVTGVQTCALPILHGTLQPIWPDAPPLTAEDTVALAEGFVPDMYKEELNARGDSDFAYANEFARYRTRSEERRVGKECRSLCLAGGRTKNDCIQNVFFFFSSRRRHTRSKRDWSSDVCSSDLAWNLAADLARRTAANRRGYGGARRGLCS